MPKKKPRRSASGLPKGAYRQPNRTIVRKGASAAGPNGRKVHLVVEQYEEPDTKQLASALIELARQMQAEQRQLDQDKDQAA